MSIVLKKKNLSTHYIEGINLSDVNAAEFSIASNYLQTELSIR